MVQHKCTRQRACCGVGRCWDSAPSVQPANSCTLHLYKLGKGSPYFTADPHGPTMQHVVSTSCVCVHAVLQGHAEVVQVALSDEEQSAQQEFK